ncbi:DUF3148 domain-containing protein [Synechococcus sp. MIT S9504]|uniref:DUF3148 domain-containing protein n=1 Tax=Synechococcus sp. MIT S9504 TaxID=1801628 RepID=UPI0007BC5BDD|nr:DUF3148 domain-containing protein [Synechococcus sp. MIT S9504]KZR87268.1 hypothetical protein MITS9504_00684 [Synechococcus sp. MIT S9504]
MSVSIGDQVRLVRPQTFLKTADPMPMLRPPDLVAHDEIGRVMALLPAETASVRFARGTFLLSIEQLTLVNEDLNNASDQDAASDSDAPSEARGSSDPGN